MPTPPSSSSEVLSRPGRRGRRAEKGAICTACQKRKLKCDGRRPFCTACQKSKIDDDCLYEDGVHKSKTQQLLEQISYLEGRIQHLETSEASSGSEHSASSPESISTDISKPATVPGPSSLRHVYSNRTLVLGPSVSDSGGLSRDTLREVGPVHSLTGVSPDSEDTSERLISIFTAHRHQLALDLPHSNLVQAFYNPFGERRQVGQAFFNVAHLWACFVSEDHYLKALEPRFEIILEESLSMIDLYQGLWDLKETGLNVLRTLALFALYYFCKGQIDTGIKYAESAANLSHRLSLHQVRSLIMNGQIAIDERGQPDKSMLQECIQAHWQVYYLISCWSLFVGKRLGEPSTSVPPESLRIDTPWPHSDPLVLQHTALVRHDILATLYGDTVLYPTLPDGSCLRYRAITLLQKASAFGTAFQPYSASPTDWVSFQCISTSIEVFSAFIPQLPTPPRGAGSVDGWHSFYTIGLARTLAGAAGLQLRTNIPDDAQIFQQECLIRDSCIRRVLEYVRLLEDWQFKFLDPFIGHCWYLIIQFLLNRQNSFRMGINNSGEGCRANNLITFAISAVGRLAKVYPVFSQTHASLEAMYNNSNTTFPDLDQP